MFACLCMHAYMRVYACIVYEYLTHVCAYMCMCTHAYMYFWQYPTPRIEVGRAGFALPSILKSFLRLCILRRNSLVSIFVFSQNQQYCKYHCEIILMT